MGAYDVLIERIKNEGKREGAIEAYTWVLDNIENIDPVLMREHINVAIKHMKESKPEDEDI